MNSELMQKEKDAIERLKAFEPKDGESVFKWRLGEDVNQLTFFDEDELYEILSDMGA